MLNTTSPPGAFIISLDFEIIWGVCDKPDVQSYYLKHLLGVRQVIPTLLKVFREYEVHGTFATVGMLFAANKQELLSALPVMRPDYTNTNLSPYREEIKSIGENEQADPLHYASGLIQLIQQTPHQEVASHTFCHYYCLENGQTAETFQADIAAAVSIAADKGMKLESLVFPRNQFNEAYVDVLRQFGFTSYRGNENSWIYEARSRETESKIRKGTRLMDAYLNISGHHIHHWKDLAKGKAPYNIPASRFLRPYNRKLSFLEPLRLRRILKEMTAAARQNAIYHLWWHPHNFGVNLAENMAFLQRILEHYSNLKEQYQFESLSMAEVAGRLNKLSNE